MLFALIFISGAHADDLAKQIRKLDPIVLTPPKDDPDHYRNLLPKKIDAELKEAGVRSTREWKAIQSLEQWQVFRKEKLALMKKALGHWPDPPKDLKVQTTKTLDGEGFKIECLVFESRPRFVVTANLYVPDPLPESCPGIIIHPSHHNPKTQSELQDMGMTWARAGCYVLVMDQVGHGERRAHPFATEADYPKPFRVGRQDYWFRYNTGMQLSLIGDSLIGWQAYDLMRGVDLLLSRKNIDKDRIIMMGSVAGGGDPVAVTAALDERIACAVVFNFGGPQPETRYPLPENADETFNYVGGGSWESTRNMAYSARDGFLPWVIVGSIAPRRLIYAHEFVWDQERDPVWKRLKQIYAWHGKPEHLSFAHGHGLLRESGDKASHCNNIGAPHRKHIYPALKKWFDIPGPPEGKEEYTKRRQGSELLALTPEVVAARKPMSMGEAALDSITGSRGGATEPVASAVDLVRVARKAFNDRLGGLDIDQAIVSSTLGEAARIHETTVHRLTVRAEGIVVPCLLLVPDRTTFRKPPVALMVAQHGKATFLSERSVAVAGLLDLGVAVCLPDVRGCGETRLDKSRGRTSWDTSISASALMLGQPMVGQRLRDLRAVVAELKKRSDVDGSSLVVWGDSFARINSTDAGVRVPFDAPETPAIAEPGGPLLATLLALFEDGVKACYSRGGLWRSQSALATPFIHFPHDVIIPGAFQGDVAAGFAVALSGKPLRSEAPINALNQVEGTTPTEDQIAYSWGKGVANIKVGGDKTPSADIEFSTKATGEKEIATWLVKQLMK